MNGILEETKVETGAGIKNRPVGACCGPDAEEVAKRIEKGVNDVKAAVSAKLEDGKREAERLLKRGRYAVEDGIDETVHQIKRHPAGALGIAFATGAVVGFLMPRFAGTRPAR